MAEPLTKEQAEQLNELTKWTFKISGGRLESSRAMTENQARMFVAERNPGLKVFGLVRVEAI